MTIVVVPGAVTVINTIKFANGLQLPVVLQGDVAGGFQVFEDEADRDSFDASKLVVGMPCRTLNPTVKTWQLKTISPLLWEEEAGGGGGSSEAPTTPWPAFEITPGTLMLPLLCSAEFPRALR